MTRQEKAARKSEKLKGQSTLRRWLPTVIICIVFDVVCVAVKGNFTADDLSPLLLANAAFLLLNRSRIIRISSGEARRAHTEQMRQTRKEVVEELKEKRQNKKRKPS